MNTSAFVTHLSRMAPDFTPQDLIDYTNDILLMIYSIPTERMRCINPLTGCDPTIKVEKDVYEYTLDLNTIGFDVLLVRSTKVLVPFSKSSKNNYPSNLVSGFVYDNIARSVQGDSTNNAKIIVTEQFAEDTSISIECYRKPNPLYSEASVIDLPDQYHLGYLDQGVWGVLETMIHGESNRYERFTTKLLPKLRGELSKEVQSRVLFAPYTEY